MFSPSGWASLSLGYDPKWLYAICAQDGSLQFISAQRQAVACRQIQQTMIPMTSVHLPCFMEAGCKAQSSILSMFDQLINSTQP